MPYRLVSLRLKRLALEKDIYIYLFIYMFLRKILFYLCIYMFFRERFLFFWFFFISSLKHFYLFICYEIFNKHDLNFVIHYFPLFDTYIKYREWIILYFCLMTKSCDKCPKPAPMCPSTKLPRRSWLWPVFNHISIPLYYNPLDHLKSLKC